MKYLLTITLALSSLTIAQDELPGWGVYVGGGLGGVTMDAPDGVTVGSEPQLPFIGVSKGLMLGVPLLVNVGLGKRGFNTEVDMGVKWKTGMSYDYLDIAVGMPFPAGPGFASAGLLFGVPLNSGTMTLDIDGESESSSIDDLEMDPDYGLMLAYSYPVNEKIGVSAGYYLGLADHGDSDVGEMKFNGIFMMVGYTF
mgnify:FL=1